MEFPREDAYCPACPDPETAFRLEDIGMKVLTDGGPHDEKWTLSVSRPAWEVVMLEHLRLTEDDEHRRLYDLCVTELIAAGKSAVDVARDHVQAVTDYHRRILEGAFRGL